MIEIICRGKSLCEAKAKCMATEILLTDENMSVDTATRILSIIGVGVRKHKAETEDT